MRNVLVVMGLLALTSCTTEKPAEVKKKEPTPEVFQAKMETSKGDIIMEIHRDWAPRGADRFYELIQEKFYNETKFHRVLKGFVAQFGVNKDPKIQALWRQLKIADDPVKEKNVRGTVTFAARGPSTRTTQLFINLKDNSKDDMDLDKMGFAPIGKVIEGMDIADKLSFLYGDHPPNGSGPDPKRMELEANGYMDRAFPRMDFIKTITIVK